MFFKYKNILYPPISRAAYSDRMAWLMAEMSRISYIEFEPPKNKLKELKDTLNLAGFDLVETFNSEVGTQVFLAERKADNIAVLAFRGTQIDKCCDIKTDIEFKFYRDKYGVRIHCGFEKAFASVEKGVVREVDKLEQGKTALYITGHSLGGALALMAAYKLSSDSVAACYTFGSPRVGNSEFKSKIKVPIYRVVNANDIVPRLPFLILTLKKSYIHQGDMRYLTPDINKIDLIANPNFFESRYRFYCFLNIGLGIRNHSCDEYRRKLAKYALKRFRSKYAGKKRKLLNLYSIKLAFRKLKAKRRQLFGGAR